MQRGIAGYRRVAVAFAGLAVVIATTTGCLGKKENTQTARNSGAKKFTLTIAANAISGGKNAARPSGSRTGSSPSSSRRRRPRAAPRR